MIPLPLPSLRFRIGLFFAYFVAIALLLGHTLRDPFIDDAIGYMGTSTEDFSKHLWLPYVDVGDTGHPQLIPYLVAPFWKLYWPGRLIFAHLAIWLTGALALCASHRLAVRLAGPRYPRLPQAVGVVAAALLLAHPLMISHVAQYLDDVPMMAFGVALVLAVVERRYAWASLWACALAFTKMTGPIGVAAVGSFELAAWLGARGWRENRKATLRRFAPYALSGALFAIYLGIKLLVLKRPLSVFDAHSAWFTKPSELIEAAKIVMRVFLHMPNYAMMFWALLACAGAAWAAGRHLLTRKMIEAKPNESTSENAALVLPAYGLMLWMTGVYCAFYTAQALWDQARWFLMFYPLLTIGGLHGLLLITRGRAALWSVPVLLWIGLQVLRWHSGWLLPLDRFQPGLSQQLKVNPAGFSMDYRAQIQLYKQAFEAVQARQPIRRVYCLYPTSGALLLPCNGYVEREVPMACVNWSSTDEALIHEVNADLSSAQGEVLTMFCSWDSLLNENRERIARHFKTEPVLRADSPEGDWIEVARVLRPDAAR